MGIGFESSTFTGGLELLRAVVEDACSLHRRPVEAVDKADWELKAHVENTIMKFYHHDMGHSDKALLKMRRVPFGQARWVADYRRRTERRIPIPVTYFPRN